MKKIDHLITPGNFLLYQTSAGLTRIEVRLQDETV